MRTRITGSVPNFVQKPKLGLLFGGGVDGFLDKVERKDEMELTPYDEQDLP